MRQVTEHVHPWRAPVEPHVDLGAVADTPHDSLPRIVEPLGAVGGAAMHQHFHTGGADDESEGAHAARGDVVHHILPRKYRAQFVLPDGLRDRGADPVLAPAPRRACRRDPQHFRRIGHLRFYEPITDNLLHVVPVVAQPRVAQRDPQPYHVGTRAALMPGVGGIAEEPQPRGAHLPRPLVSVPGKRHGLLVPGGECIVQQSPHAHEHGMHMDVEMGAFPAGGRVQVVRRAPELALHPKVRELARELKKPHVAAQTAIAHKAPQRCKVVGHRCAFITFLRSLGRLGRGPAGYARIGKVVAEPRIRIPGEVIPDNRQLEHALGGPPGQRFPLRVPRGLVPVGQAGEQAAVAGHAGIVLVPVLLAVANARVPRPFRAHAIVHQPVALHVPEHGLHEAVLQVHLPAAAAHQPQHRQRFHILRHHATDHAAPVQHVRRIRVEEGQEHALVVECGIERPEHAVDRHPAALGQVERGGGGDVGSQPVTLQLKTTHAALLPMTCQP